MRLRVFALTVSPPRRRPRAGLPVVLLAALLGSAAGCRHPAAAVTTRPAIPDDSNAELVAYIADQPFVCAEAAMRSVYVLAKGEVFEGDSAALETAMRADGLLPRGWSHAPGDFLNRAEVSYMLAKAIHLRSGLNWQLTGLGRYAHRELIYRGIAHPGSELKLVSGGEFLGMLQRANEYLDRHGGADHAELGSEPR